MFKIGTWNVNGVATRKTDIELFLEEHRLQVLVLQETRLVPGRRASFRNYSVYRLDGQGNYGLAVLVRRGVEHYVAGAAQGVELHNYSVHVKVNNVEIVITNIYRPGAVDISQNDFDILLSGNKARILLGDFNAKSQVWNCTREDVQGRRVIRQANDHYASIVAPVMPTHLPYGRGQPEVLDFAICKRLPFDAEVTTEQSGTSDHNPVVMTLHNTVVNEAGLRKKKTNWTGFKNDMKTTFPLPRIDTMERIEEAALEYAEAIRSAYDRNTETKNIRLGTLNDLPGDLQDLIRENRRLRRIYGRLRDPDSRRELNLHTARMKEATKLHRETMWLRKMESLETSTRDRRINAWDLQKNLRNPRTHMPVIHGMNGLAYTDQDKADAFADTLEGVFQDNLDEDEEEAHIERTERRARRIRNTETANVAEDYATPQEIKKIVRHLKTRKAPGMDGINNKMLKELPPRAMVAITNLANAILKLDHFPECWKESSVLMLPKAGKDTKFPGNYRPISLLPSIGKVIERVIKRRMVKYVDDNNILPDFQYGFRSQYSAEQQAYRITEIVTEGYNNKELTGAVFLDIERAFDKLWHDRLIVKMEDMGFPIKMVKLVDSYLQGRTFHVRVKEARTRPREIEAGVPQGSVLGPILYSIYISDIPTTPLVATALFADDTAVMTRHRNIEIVQRRLQNIIERLEEWCLINKIKINTGKTQAIVFQKRRRQPTRNLTIGGNIIEWKNYVNYLGLTMDRGLTWRKHIRMAAGKTNKTVQQMMPMLGNQGLNIRTKKTLIKAVARAQLTYGSSVWGYTAKSHMQRIKSTENRIIRRAIGAPWYVRNIDIQRDIEWTPVGEFIKGKARKFFLRAEAHPDPAMRTATGYDPVEERRVRRVYYNRPRDLFRQME